MELELDEKAFNQMVKAADKAQSANKAMTNDGVRVAGEAESNVAMRATDKAVAGGETRAENESIATDGAKKDKKSIKKHGWLVMVVCGLMGIMGGIVLFLLPILLPEETLPDLDFPSIPSEKVDNNIYSKLTGLPLADAKLANAPAYCIQTPNGTDGGRPQSGIDQAGVVFEAIAEAGITRFAAIYQNPTTAVIGPIRSLRLYYLEWDTPFDCTIVHAGGAPNAIEAVAAGGYRDLSENYNYMYRGTYGSRLWNNLFTTPTELARASTDAGYTGSEIKEFSRMTPNESLHARVDKNATEKLVITEPARGDTSVLTPGVTNIAVNFGGWATFNVRYAYNAETNKYARSFESGASHDIYVCPEEDLGEVNPEDVCTLTAWNTDAVVAMMVQESRYEDNYHEKIPTVGSGEVYVFQNGQMSHGTWSKNSVAEQIRFYNESGAEIALTPGQVIVEAVPQYGSVEY